MRMINNDVLPVSRTRNLRKTNKEGKIHKKDGNIPIEMKKYKVNELTALQGNYAKICLVKGGLMTLHGTSIKICLIRE